MNKSLKFLAISLLMIPTLARADQGWKARVYGWFVNSYTTEFAKGAVAGAASEFGIDAIRSVSPQFVTKLHKDQATGQIKVIVAHAGLYGLDWAQANTDGMSAQQFGLRTAGMLAGSHGLRFVANTVNPQK